MRLTFGMFLDGADWSDKAASLGEIKMGPLQFLAWLEGRLGLDGVSVSGESITLTAGFHVIEAEVTGESGKKDIVTLEITVQ